MHLNLCICIYNHSAVCIYIYAFVFVYLYFCIHIWVFGLTITVRCAFIIEYSCLCIYVFAFIFVYLYLQLRHGVRYELPAFASIRCRSTPWPLLLIRLHPYIIKLLDKQTNKMQPGAWDFHIKSYPIYIYQSFSLFVVVWRDATAHAAKVGIGNACALCRTDNLIPRLLQVGEIKHLYYKFDKLIVFERTLSAQGLNK